MDCMHRSTYAHQGSPGGGGRQHAPLLTPFEPLPVSVALLVLPQRSAAQVQLRQLIIVIQQLLQQGPAAPCFQLAVSLTAWCRGLLAKPLHPVMLKSCDCRQAELDASPSMQCIYVNCM